MKVSLHRIVSIGFLCIPPHDQIEQDKMENLIKQLPKLFIFLRDFNSHDIIWGFNETNKKGKIMEKFIIDNELCLLNDRAKTNIYPATGSLSEIDLDMCDPAISLNFTWNV